MAAALPKDPPRPPMPKGVVLDTGLESPLATIPPLPKPHLPKPASRRRQRSVGAADGMFELDAQANLADRAVRARVGDKDLGNDSALAMAAAEAVAAENKDGDVDKSLVQEEVDASVDARRSSEFKALPEEVRVRDCSSWCSTKSNLNPPESWRRFPAVTGAQSGRVDLREGAA